MTTHVTRELVHDYYQARVSRDPARIGPFLDDDIHWSIAGPVDLMHFCGERRGKQAVIDAIVRHVPSQLEVTGMELEEVLIDGDRAATFSRLTARQISTGRTITYRCANFLHFRDNRIIRFHALIDSFDAAEQMLGHAIDVSVGEAAADDQVMV
jgi:ketosteroid isomerase-like protein